jgi:hypothetical protein
MKGYIVFDLLDKQNFVHVFQLALYLEIPRLQSDCLHFFVTCLKSHGVRRFRIGPKRNIKTLTRTLTDPRAQRVAGSFVSLWNQLHQLERSSNWEAILLSGDIHLPAESLVDVSWITNALNTGSLFELTRLTLHDNQIQTFELNLEVPLALKSLILSDNVITDISSVVLSINQGKLSHLEELDLENNIIETFDLHLTTPLQLRLLKLNRNQITNIEPLMNALYSGHIPPLKELRVSQNRISDLPIDPQKPLLLKKIFVASNQITNIDSLVLALNNGNLPILEVLDLRGNPTQIMASWRHLTQPCPELMSIIFDWPRVNSLEDVLPFYQAYQDGLIPNLIAQQASEIELTYYRFTPFIDPIINYDDSVTVIVDRQYLYQTSKRAFLLHPNMDFARTKIQFAKEVGQDEGGLAHDFVHHLSLALTPYFQVMNQDAIDEDQARPLYYFKVYEPDRKDDYRFIGRFLAFAFIKKASLSIEFLPIFFKMLIEGDKKDMKFEDYEFFDPQDYNMRKRQYNNPEALSYYTFCVDGTPISGKYSCETSVTIQNRRDYYK